MCSGMLRSSAHDSIQIVFELSTYVSHVLPTRHGPLICGGPTRIGPTSTDTDRQETNTDRRNPQHAGPRAPTRTGKSQHGPVTPPTQTGQSKHGRERLQHGPANLNTRGPQAPTRTGKSQHVGPQSSQMKAGTVRLGQPMCPFTSLVRTIASQDPW